MVGVRFQSFMFLGRSDVALMVLLKAVRPSTVAIGLGAVSWCWAVCIGCRAVLRRWRAAARWRSMRSRSSAAWH